MSSVIEVKQSGGRCPGGFRTSHHFEKARGTRDLNFQRIFRGLSNLFPSVLVSLTD